MKSRKTVLIALLVVGVLSVSYVWAQCSTSGACCSAAATTGTIAAMTSVKAGHECPFKTAGIELTAQQQQKVMAILVKTRTDITALLTADQKVKFSKVDLLGAMLAKKACGPECTKPCCVTTATEQTTCPIMKGNPINKSVFTVYQGKKVYFCCPGCDTAFNKNPEKYVKELPQFKNLAL